MPALTVQVPPITSRSVSALPGPIVSFAFSPQQVLPFGHVGAADMDLARGATIRNAAVSSGSKVLIQSCAKIPDPWSGAINNSLECRTHVPRGTLPEKLINANLLVTRIRRDGRESWHRLHLLRTS